MASGTAEQLVQVAGIFINRQSIIGPNVVVEYLLLERTVLPFNWTTPRVDLYPGEDEFTAAVRKTQEVTGLTLANITIDSYYWNEDITHRGRMRFFYWLASLNGEPEVKLSHEHKDFCWAPLPRAIELVGYDLSMKEFLETAEKYLTQKDLALAIEQLSPF